MVSIEGEVMQIDVSVTDFKNPKKWPLPYGVWQLFLIQKKDKDGKQIAPTQQGAYYAAEPLVRAGDGYVMVGKEKLTYPQFQQRLTTAGQESFSADRSYWRFDAMSLLGSGQPQASLADATLGDKQKTEVQIAEKNAETRSTAIMLGGSGLLAYLAWRNLRK